MTDPQAFLTQLHQNLAIRRQREVKHAGNEPLDLLNQLTDHCQSISLTEQADRGDLSEAAWRESLRPLLVNIGDRSEVRADCRVEVSDNIKRSLRTGSGRRWSKSSDKRFELHRHKQGIYQLVDRQALYGYLIFAGWVACGCRLTPALMFVPLWRAALTEVGFLSGFGILFVIGVFGL